jgi:hypothetical protein
MACDPQSLMSAAQCFDCLSPGQQMSVLLYLMCQIQQNGSTGGGGAGFASAQFPLTATGYTTNHGLGGVPSIRSAVLVCVSPDANTFYVPGDEIDVDGISVTSGGGPAFTLGDNSTAIFAGASMVPLGNENNYELNAKGGGIGTVSPASFNNFRLKFYARL